jgi:predicted NBD/HSP70 family sugar kinase
MRIGLDLGGTKVEAVALSETGAELLRFRRPTPVGDYRATVQLLADMVAEIESSAGAAASIGLGTPGTIDPVSGLMKNSNSTALNGKPLDRDVESALSREIAMANDADCFTVSEAHDGGGAGSGVVFGVILGTGVGGGLVVNGRLVSGPNRIAGELGHNPLPWISPAEVPGPDCYCGRQGCIETFLSGPGIAADHARRAGATLAAAEIAAAAAAGERDASHTMDRFHDRLARALSGVINIVDPDVIVLGGGVSNIESIYEAVPGLWSGYVFGGTVLTRLVRAVHGDSSGVLGAARLWHASGSGVPSGS